MNYAPPSTINYNNGAAWKIEVVYKYILALNYCPWCFLSTSAPDAPYNDLMLLKSVMDYAELDKLMSNSAEKAFLRHLYAVPEMIPLSVFSSVVSTNEREKIAERAFTV